MTETSISIASTGTPGSPGRDANYLYEYAGTAFDPSINPGVLVPGTGVQAAYILNPDAWPLNPSGGYASPTYSEKWIGPQMAKGSDGYLTAPAGDYIYQTSFYIAPSFNLSTVLIWGAIASDNCTVGVAINGTLVSHTGSSTLMVPGTCMKAENTFAIGGSTAALGTTQVNYFATGTFHSGINTIQFIVQNNNVGSANLDNPSGLIVWMQAQGMATPEASTAGLLIAGLAAVAWLRRRRLRPSA